MPTITVRDIMRLALPPGSHVVAGISGLRHQITWTAMMRMKSPAFVDLRGGEVALLSVKALQSLDPPQTLSRLVRRLAQAPVSAVTILGNVNEADIEAAESVRLPLLQIPEGSDLREVEREINRLISDYEAQLERRGAQLYNRLTQCSLSENGLVDLLKALVEHTNQCVACYAANGEMLAQFGPGTARVALQSLHPTSQGDNSLVNQEIWVETIGSPDHPGGFLAMAGLSLDEWDRLATRQGAAALALLFAREQAVQAAEDRLRGDFLSAVLAGQPSDPATLIQRGEELGYDLNRPYIALLLSLDENNSALQNRLMSSLQQELSRRSIAAPLLRRENTVLCMVPLKSNNGLRPRDLVEALRERLVVDYQELVVAIGTPAATVMEWGRSLKEAEQALTLGKQLFGAQRVLAFNDLGVYRLLVLLRESPEMWSFYRETLSKLVAYDRKQGGKQGGELLQTLDEYFNHLGNLRATAEALHVHRNTLLYRLDRIKQISGMNLDDPEEHFALWLSLRAHRVLSVMGEDVAP